MRSQTDGSCRNGICVCLLPAALPGWLDPCSQSLVRYNTTNPNPLDEQPIQTLSSSHSRRRCLLLLLPSRPSFTPRRTGAGQHVLQVQLPGAVAAAHHRAAGHVQEAHLLGGARVRLERRRGDKLRHRHVPGARMGRAVMWLVRAVSIGQWRSAKRGQQHCTIAHTQSSSHPLTTARPGTAPRSNSHSLLTSWSAACTAPVSPHPPRPRAAAAWHPAPPPGSHHSPA